MRISDWSSDVCSSDLDLAFLGLVRVARERVEPLAVFHARPQQSWARVEPAQKPIVNPGRIHAPSLDASVRQPAAQAVADDIEHLFWRLAAAARLSGGPAIDDHAHAPRLTPPEQPRDHQIGRAHVVTQVPNATIVCRLLIE